MWERVNAHIDICVLFTTKRYVSLRKYSNLFKSAFFDHQFVSVSVSKTYVKNDNSKIYAGINTELTPLSHKHLYTYSHLEIPD